MDFDLLTTVEYGGCSAKLSAAKLTEALSGLPKVKHPDLLVDIETHDDAGVYRISPETALIQTVDFFPPVCSDPYEFGQIAAANALSDVYAMGGKALTAMNIALFPSNRIALEVLARILRGGQDKVAEADCLIVGGHTIDDYPPKYGLSVTGVVHPDRVITNAAAKPGDALILTKPLGTGIVIAGRRMGMADDTVYRGALDSMKLLNKNGAALMQRFDIRSATDITGFGLLGHAANMARQSGVTFRIFSATLPLLPGAYEIADTGCLPGACFRNQEYAEGLCRFDKNLSYTRRMIMFDAQTSGGLFIAAPHERARQLCDALAQGGYPAAVIVGDVAAGKEPSVEIV
ncbi:MAG TPA: selenide, water dikinase SelD [Chitinivibrionales bacterium]